MPDPEGRSSTPTCCVCGAVTSLRPRICGLWTCVDPDVCDANFGATARCDWFAVDGNEIIYCPLRGRHGHNGEPPPSDDTPLALSAPASDDASRCDLYGSGKHSFLGGAGCICGATDDASA